MAAKSPMDQAFERQRQKGRGIQPTKRDTYGNLVRPSPPPRQVVHPATSPMVPPGMPNTPANRNRQAQINVKNQQNREKRMQRRMEEFDRRYGKK